VHIVHSVPHSFPLSEPNQVLLANFPSRPLHGQGWHKNVRSPADCINDSNPFSFFRTSPPYHHSPRSSRAHSLSPRYFLSASVFLSNTIRTLPYTTITNPRRFHQLSISSRILANSASCVVTRFCSLTFFVTASLSSSRIPITNQISRYLPSLLQPRTKRYTSGSLQIIRIETAIESTVP
jgi:hypothetical protein